MDEITLPVTDQEYIWLSYLSEYYGISLADLIKQRCLAPLEKEYQQLIETKETAPFSQ
ncbi:hypothetical protein [Jeotgalibaca caeni]|uniref:hypothetical protein n=1 Tax=Jeotgalibaca caeni TaxID=3028623 RepID=UPI00237E8813|nr:hypothetical protein [Jeotgalibaca caeni]MDE1549203.1 hypothetical protein [Jeotgalibaca caeni]